MENVKFVHISKDSDNGIVDLYFRIHDRLANCIRKYTKYSQEELLLYLSEDNVFHRRIQASKDFDEIQDSVVETIERISNSGDDEFFFNHLITDNGRRRSPREIHQLMSREYGLADIDEAEEQGRFEDDDAQIEWWVAHFFIAYGRLLCDEPSGLFESGESDTHESVDPSVVSEILSKIKSIDSIIVVDDVRKYGPGEIKALHDKLVKE